MIELLEKNPKAAKVVRKHYLQKLIDSLKVDLPEEFKEHVKQQGVTNEIIAGLIDDQPRLLFDVFDENGTYIYVNPAITGTKRKFSFTIFNKNHENFFGEEYDTRKEAEKASIEKAFEILEEEL